MRFGHLQKVASGNLRPDLGARPKRVRRDALLIVGKLSRLANNPVDYLRIARKSGFAKRRQSIQTHNVLRSRQAPPRSYLIAMRLLAAGWLDLLKHHS
jgi:ribosomal protein L34